MSELMLSSQEWSFVDMNQDPYLTLYNQINWDAPHGPLRCAHCCEFGSPNAGSYPSDLAHFEQILGPFPEQKSAARLLLVLQDPPHLEHNFSAANPLTSGSDLGAAEHRYFCLSPVAWRTLKLDQATGSQSPCWPTPVTAPFFLRRYLKRGGSWSYDGFLTYFLYLLAPEDALITNLAKCHFGERMQDQVYERCAGTHLSTEISLLKPNLLLTFTDRLNPRFLKAIVPELSQVSLIRLRHPAARIAKGKTWKNETKKRRDLFLQELQRVNAEASALGVDVPRISARWMADVEQCLTSSTESTD